MADCGTGSGQSESTLITGSTGSSATRPSILVSKITITNHEHLQERATANSICKEGEYKKVMQYYDGCMRRGKVQTNLSSDSATLI